MWVFVHVVYDHGGEAEWGDSVLCDDGCPFNNLLLHHNEHIHMTSVCWFSVLAYVRQLYSYFPSSAAELNNMKDLRQWIKRRVMLELFLFIYHCMKSWMPCWGVLVDLDWMSVLAVSVRVYVCNSVCARTLVSMNYSKYQHFSDFRCVSSLITAGISSHRTIKTANKTVTDFTSPFAAEIQQAAAKNRRVAKACDKVKSESWQMTTCSRNTLKK